MEKNITTKFAIGIKLEEIGNQSKNPYLFRHPDCYDYCYCDIDFIAEFYNFKDADDVYRRLVIEKFWQYEESNDEFKNKYCWVFYMYRVDFDGDVPITGLLLDQIYEETKDIESRYSCPDTFNGWKDWKENKYLLLSRIVIDKDFKDNFNRSTKYLMYYREH